MRDGELEEIKRRTRVLYDQQASEYADKTRNYDKYPGLLTEIHRFLTRTVPGLPVVDLGCGAGRDSRHLLELGHSVVALDLSGRMVEATAAHCDHHPRLGLVQADLCHTPFRSASFGGALASASLLHLPSRHLPAALDEIRRVLVPGARVSISMKSGQGEGWSVGRTLGQPRWFTFVLPDEFASLMRQRGFVDVSISSGGRREWFIAEGTSPSSTRPGWSSA